MGSLLVMPTLVVRLADPKAFHLRRGFRYPSACPSATRSPHCRAGKMCPA